MYCISGGKGRERGGKRGFLSPNVGVKYGGSQERPKKRQCSILQPAELSAHSGNGLAKHPKRVLSGAENKKNAFIFFR